MTMLQNLFNMLIEILFLCYTYLSWCLHFLFLAKHFLHVSILSLVFHYCPVHTVHSHPQPSFIDIVLHALTICLI